MPDVVVSIIVKDTEKAIRETKKLENRFDQFAKKAKQAGQAIKTIGATAGLAIGILFGLSKAVEAIANRLGELGRKDVSKSLTELNSQFQELIDQILTMQTPLGTTGDILIKLFDGLVVSLRALGVMLEMASGGLQMMVVDAQRLLGVMQELTGQTTQFTESWRKANREMILSATNARIGLIWEGKLTETIKQQNDAIDRSAAKLHNKRNNLDDLMKAQKGLNDETNKGRQIEDAIRRGDARALADLQASGGSASADSAMTAGGGMKANRPGFVATSRNRGDYDFAGGGGRPAGEKNTTSRASDSQKIGSVTVYLGNKPVMDAAAEVFVDGVKQSQSQGMSGGRKKLGHGR